MNLYIFKVQMGHGGADCALYTVLAQRMDHAIDTVLEEHSHDGCLVMKVERTEYVSLYAGVDIEPTRSATE